MILDLTLSELFDQPIDEVWAALTDPVTLAKWLMPNDFEPRVGKRFTMTRADPGWRGVVSCAVLELEAPRRMVWSWFTGDEPDGRPSRVVFELSAEGRGTRLVIHHYGSADDRTGELVRGRWPEKLANLRAFLFGT
jgi:uncharacterized protein YndB with AHSA1/START domain